MPSIEYTLSFPHAAGHLIDVTLTLAAPDPGGQRLTLPNWIPGSYMIRDFSRHIVRLHASANGEEVTLEKLDKSSWRAPPGLEALRIELQVYAWELSVRAAHVDRTHAFFNGTSVFLRVEGQEHEPVDVIVERPVHTGAEAWEVATAMDPVEVDGAGFGRYRAHDHDEAIDHPFELGAFERLRFEAGGVPHEIVLTDAAPFDAARLVRDLTRVCEHHVRFFGEPAPMPRYVFLTMLVDAGYGGLEHRASTALLATREHLPVPSADAPDDAPDGLAREERYVEFLGLCSHEYFHTWNVKRIKPARFVPYALEAESYTRLLWFFEGVTSYYDDLALVRAGLVERARYVELLGKTITRVERGAGRLRQSVAESSFDAWHKFYKQDENAPNAIVSYYAKGALVALCLDARLREATGGRASLDTLLHVLWARWLADGAGLAEDEPERVAAEIAGCDLHGFFDLALRSTEPLPLEDALRTLGARLEWRVRESAKDVGGKAARSGERSGVGRAAGDHGSDADVSKDGTRATDTPPWLGATLAAAPDGVKIAQVTNDGPAERAGLAPGDRIVAIDRLAFAAADIDAVLRRHASAADVLVHHFRFGRLLESRLPIETPPADTAVVTLVDPDGPLAWLDATGAVA